MRTFGFFLTFFFLLAIQAKPCFAVEYFEKLPKFSKVEISGRMTVQIEAYVNNIVTNTENSMKINVKSGSIKDLDYFMSGETLVLRKKGGIIQTRNIVITLNISNTISQLDVSTGALVRAYRNIFDERAEIKAESGSYLDLFVDNSSLFINSGRNSSVIMKGRLDRIEARTSNSGLIDAELLAVSRAFVSAYTGSTIKINAIEYLEATAGMKSSVYYKQTPAIKHLSELAGGEYIEF